jgi:hypothetical protein
MAISLRCRAGGAPSYLVSGTEILCRLLLWRAQRKRIRAPGPSRTGSAGRRCCWSRSPTRRTPPPGWHRPPSGRADSHRSRHGTPVPRSAPVSADNLLGDAVGHRGDTQRSRPARRLGDVHPAHRRRHVAGGRQPVPELVEVIGKPFLEVLDRLPIHSSRSLVRLHPLEGFPDFPPRSRTASPVS